MEKELKSCTGVLLRADLTRHGHPTLFGIKGLETYIALLIFLEFRMVCSPPKSYVFYEWPFTYNLSILQVYLLSDKIEKGGQTCLHSNCIYLLSREQLL